MERPDSPQRISVPYSPDPLSDNPEQPTAASAFYVVPKITLTYSPAMEPAFRVVPLELLRHHLALPFGVDEEHRVVSIACATHGDNSMITEITPYLPGMRLDIYLADFDSINGLLDKLSAKYHPEAHDVPQTTRIS